MILFFQALVGQEITLSKGAVIDSLVVNDSIGETYSLYLPTAFSTDRTWPVIFAFDAEGRGRATAQLLRQAAEAQGYIIASSNNISQDFSLLDNVKVGTRLMNRVFSFFPIDSNGVHTVGSSEGARVASALPTVFPDIKGVIAVGDTWVNKDFLMRGANFSFIGLVGYEDYRNFMLEGTTALLKRAGLQAALYKYEGGHEWPTGEMTGNALGGLTLQAMAKGFRPADPALVEALYQNDMETVESLRRKLQHYKAYEYLESLISKYDMYGKKDEINQRLKEIRSSRPFKEQRRAYNRAALKEAELMDRYIYFFTEDVNAAHFENLGWWSEQIKELEKLQEASSPAERELAHRMQGMLQSLANTTFKDFKQNKVSIDPLIFTAILQTIFDRENPKGYLNIISLSGQDGDYYTALLYLEDLLKTGYKDMEGLYNIPGTLDLKLSPEYNELIKKYLGESRYYDN